MYPSIYPLDPSLAPWSIAGNIHRSIHCSLNHRSFDISLIRPLLPDRLLASWLIAPSITPDLSLFDYAIAPLLSLLSDPSLLRFILDPSLSPWSIACFLINCSFHCSWSITFHCIIAPFIAFWSMFPSIYHLDPLLAPWSIAGTIYRSFHCSLVHVSLIHPLFLSSSLTPWAIPYSLIDRLLPDQSLLPLPLIYRFFIVS
jgi:hypothetical protein